MFPDKLVQQQAGGADDNEDQSGDYNNATGIYLRSDKNIISYNYILNNGKYGISVDSSSENTISHNDIINNSEIGIFIYPGYHNTISYNNIINNGEIGIFIDLGYDNTISRNNLINNDRNAYFESYWWFLTILLQHKKNTWNANYYSDLNGGRFYIIHGRIHFLLRHSFPWFNIDWNPVQEPYDLL